MQRILNRLTLRIFNLNRSWISLPATVDEAGDWSYGDQVRIKIQKPDMEDLKAVEEGDS